MYVKTLAKVSGIPAAQVASSPGVTDSGMAQVMTVISALDAFAIPAVVASLRMSSTEARDVAARIIAAADEADRLANHSQLAAARSALLGS